MMNTDSSEPVVDWDIDLDNIDFDNIDVDSLFEDQLGDALNDSCVEATAINPNIPSQPSMPSIDGDTNLGGESSNVILQNKNQNQLQLQQATGTLGYVISGRGQQQGNNIYSNRLDPVGFSTTDQFFSGTAYHQYILRQIKIMKNRYTNELLKMHYNVTKLIAQTTNMEAIKYYESVVIHLVRIMTFLNITRAELLPPSDEMIYNIMNMIVNYVSYYMNEPGCYSQLRELAHQPLGAMRLQDNLSTNPSQRVSNLEPNMWNFNETFPFRRPYSQPSESRLMSSSINITSYQTARHPSVQSTTPQINMGPMTNSVVGSSYPLSLFSNTTATNFPSRPLNHQRPVANQNFNFEKMKAPMHQMNELTRSKAPHGMSPLFPGLVNQCSLPANVNPIPPQTSSSTSKFGVNNVLSPHSTARSPFFLSSNSASPSKTSPEPEPESSKDQAIPLTEVVKPMSSKQLISSLTDISPIKKVTDIIPACVPPNLDITHIQDETNVMLEYDHEPLQKRKRELSSPSVFSDQFVSQSRDACLTETSANKRKKIELKKSPILEEIKKINNMLLETSIDAVIDPSEDDFSILEAHEGTIVKCLFRNVCSLLGPRKGASSEKMPEFVILLVVPDNYPASSPKIIRSRRYVLNNEPWVTLYDEMLTKLDLSLYGIPGITTLRDMARHWDASARAVMTEFLQKRGGKSFGDKYGSWDNCLNSSSSSS